MVKPNVLLDQHFFTDTRVLNRIVSIACLNKKDIVLEIGAGTGILTREISKRAKKVIAIEIDKRFLKVLKLLPKNVDVIIGDALKIKYPTFTKIVSNPPYQVCEALIRKLVNYDFTLSVLTVPKNFALKLKSKKTMIGLFASFFYNIDLLFDVPKESFFPQPRTRSAVIIITPKEENPMKTFLLQKSKKAKNALIQTLVEHKNLTKNQAKEKISKMNMLHKTVNKLSYKQIKKINHLLKRGCLKLQKHL